MAKPCTPRCAVLPSDATTTRPSLGILITTIYLKIEGYLCPPLVTIGGQGEEGIYLTPQLLTPNEI